MKTDDALWDEIIREGRADVDSWPSLLNNLLSRLDDIIHNAFPVVQPSSAGPTADSGSTPRQTASISAGDEASKQSLNSGNMGSADNLNDGSSSGTSHTNANSIASEDLAIAASLKEILSTTFSASPPHTVQRLAELLRNPTQHYHNLTKYLRAMQRVLSVSSTISQFPLPLPADLPEGSMGISGFANIPLGSDESLGGALLTPISWLKPDTVEPDEESRAIMPNGVMREVSPDLDQDMENIQSRPSSTEGSLEDIPIQIQGPPVLGPEDIGPQPEGLVLPDIVDGLRGNLSPSRQLTEEHASGLTREKEAAERDVAMSNVDDNAGDSKGKSPEKSDDSMDLDSKEDSSAAQDLVSPNSEAAVSAETSQETKDSS